MKKVLSFVVLLFVLVTIAAAVVHPLVGKWKFSEVIGGVRFYDYITIITVNTTTKKVSGYWTGIKTLKVAGYYSGNIIFIGDVGCDWYMDAWYFTFQGTTPLKKHLGVCSIYHDFDASWQALTATRLSSSITSFETMSLNDAFNQKMLKIQAHLRERMTGGLSPK